MMPMSAELRRFLPADPAHNLTSRERLRLQLAEDVANFLRWGGRIDVLDTRRGEPKPSAPRQAKQDNAIGFQADVDRGRVIVDGEEWISLDKAAGLAGWSKGPLRVAMSEGRYPETRKLNRRIFVRLVDALSWAVENGRYQCDRDAAIRELEALA